MIGKPIRLLSLLKIALIGAIIMYCVVVTIVALRMKPKTILIGIDGRNTRVINQDSDALLEAEKINFVIAFLESYYSYDSKNFSEKSREAKTRMSPALWQKKKDELPGTEKKIREEGLTQRHEVLSLREIDKATYQADLKLRIDRRGGVAEIFLRVELKLRKRVRDEEIPYSIEVEVFDEKRVE
jgi:hypothetical protein